MKNEEINRADLVASFQNAVVEALVSRAVMAAKENGCKKLAVAGGVAANSALRAALEEECGKIILSSTIHRLFSVPIMQQ